jgi:hypothetical protein
MLVTAQTLVTLLVAAYGAVALALWLWSLRPPICAYCGKRHRGWTKCEIWRKYDQKNV